MRKDIFSFSLLISAVTAMLKEAYKGTFYIRLKKRFPVLAITCAPLGLMITEILGKSSSFKLKKV